MVKVEMEYNPYLRETLVKFNGKSPRINSLVEKYDKELLQTWLSKLPSIFYDEMNGYDFDLEFSGTELDYEDLVNQFTKIGVGDDLVHIFKKNNLSERESKVNDIDSLLEWLKENSNKNFNEEKFRFSHKELFEDTYSFIVLHGTGMDTETVNKNEISVEFINDIKELHNVNLELTPILFNINRESLDLFQNDLTYVMTQPNVILEQLFFLIDPSLNAYFVRRIIQDLGIQNPNVVTSFDEAIIKKYMQVYPVTDYIYQSIKTFRKETDALDEMLTEKKRASEIKNREIYEQINTLEDYIFSLKLAINKFLSRSNMEIPEEWTHEKTILIGMIKNWRIRKTKMVGEDEARNMAFEFEDELKYWYREFLETVQREIQKTQNEIINQFSKWYKDAEYDSYFVPNVSEKTKVEAPMLPLISYELLKLRKEEKAEARGGLFRMFSSTPDPNANEPVIQIVSYYQEWREYVVEVVKPIIEKYIEDNFNALTTYLNETSKVYEEHISKLITQLTDKKDEVASQLSEEEQLLQDDIDWLVEFTDQVKAIERG